VKCAKLLRSANSEYAPLHAPDSLVHFKPPLCRDSVLVVLIQESVAHQEQMFFSYLALFGQTFDFQAYLDWAETQFRLLCKDEEEARPLNQLQHENL
jgi:hypothetical protein